MVGGSVDVRVSSVKNIPTINFIQRTSRNTVFLYGEYQQVGPKGRNEAKSAMRSRMGEERKRSWLMDVDRRRCRKNYLIN